MPNSPSARGRQDAGAPSYAQLFCNKGCSSNMGYPHPMLIAGPYGHIDNLRSIFRRAAVLDYCPWELSMDFWLPSCGAVATC
jgi:hypothetical protein